MVTIAILFAAGFAGGVLTAVAGGATFATFPALLVVGVPALNANASSMVALFPAYVVSAWAFRREIADIGAVEIRRYAAVCVAGTLAGALLLLWTPGNFFAALVPYLMLAAALAFAIGNFAPPRLLAPLRLGPGAALAVLLAISVYGGYFGAGAGFMILAVLTLAGMRDILAMNGLKLLLAGVMTVVAVATFIVAGLVDWRMSLPMLAGSALGGHAGAHGAKRLDERALKALIAALGFGLTVYYFRYGV